MFKNYLKIALRSMKRHKIYSFLNITGLTIGMTCFILILLWVQDELSFDKFHENANQLYRVITEQHHSGQVTRTSETQFPLAVALKNDFPEISNSARLLTKWGNKFIKYKSNSFNENRVFFADPSFLEMFSFPLQKGDPETALLEPYSIVLTQETAYKYFKNEDPIGKILQIDYFNKLTDFKVTGILKNIPHNSHLQFDFLLPFHLFDYSDVADPWSTVDNYQTYVLLNKYASLKEINQKIADYKSKHVPGSHDKYYLQPLTRIHLYSDVKFDSPANSDIRYVYFFTVISIFILLIACINFMNLSTARSANRAKEVGLRKVIGAQRIQLIRQFFGESLLYSFVAFVCAIIFVIAILPLFNNLSGKTLSIAGYRSAYIFLFLLGVTIMTGGISGSYPAFFLSSFTPVSVLTGSLSSMMRRTKSNFFRKPLVIIQFSISIILIIGTLIVSSQLRFLQNKNLGFNKDNLIYIPVRGDLAQNYKSLKRELLGNPNIKGVTAANILPKHGNESLLDEWEGNTDDDKIVVNITSVDYDYFKTLNMKIVQGRNFSKAFPADLSEAVIVNEEAVRQMGMVFPIGKRLWGKRIIGVVKDYHYKSLHEPIEPIVLSLTNRWLYFIFIKINSHSLDLAGTIKSIKDVYEKFVSEYPFEFHFLDTDIDNFYYKEKQIHKTFTYFTFLGIFIACLGLFGLASFTAEQRTKEIGIRKVLGASVSSIVLLLTKEFTKWVLISNLIAWPFAYYAMNKWLQNFAYHINISVWLFIISAGLTLVIAFLTVSYQSIKAALANPVESLGYE